MADPRDPRRHEPPDGDETEETRLLPGDDAWPDEDEPTAVQRRRRPAPPPPPRRRERVYEEREPPRRPLPPPPPPQRALWPWLLALLLLVAAGLVAAYLLTREGEDERRAVPPVVRLPEQNARDRLEREGFEVDVERGAADMPPGIVFAQTPGGGRTLPEGATVTIHVSEGPSTATVPDVVGLAEASARERLRGVELEAAPESVFSEEQPPGAVVSQEPAAGEEVERGSAVRLEVSQGSGRVVVPDVVGLLVEEATAALGEQDLEANPVQVPSREPEGTVVAQNPAGGAEATRGDTVRLNVSRGP